MLRIPQGQVLYGDGQQIREVNTDDNNIVFEVSVVTQVSTMTLLIAGWDGVLQWW